MATVTGPSLEELNRRGDSLTRAVTKKLRAVARSVRLDPVIPTEADLSPVRAEWRNVVEGVLLPMVEREWLRSARDMRHQIENILGSLTASAEDPFEVPPVRNIDAEKYLAKASNHLSGIGDELWGHMRDELSLGLQSGESVVQLQDRMIDTADVTAPRAEVIARTEVVGASNRGSLAQIDAWGVPYEKTWLASGDSRTRESHENVSGQSVKNKEHFLVGGAAMDGPHDPGGPAAETVNCRCTLTYEIQEDDITDPFSLTAAGDEPLTTGMIALIPSAEDVSRLVLDGEQDEPEEELHLTLVFLGDVTGYTEEDQDRLVDSVSDAVKGSGPVEARAFGAAIFNPDSEKFNPCLVLIVGGNGRLTGLREDLITTVREGVGIDLPEQHQPFIPHVTLCYTEQLERVQELVKRVGPIKFDQIRFAFGETVVDVSL